MTPPKGSVLTDMDSRSVTVRGRVAEYLEAGSGTPTGRRLWPGKGQARGRLHGNATPVVLLHANGETARDWRWTMPALAEHHRVFALDLPGFGGTDPTEDYRPASLAEWLVGVLDALDLPRVTLVGNSLGGLVALQTAMDHPQRVERLVLVAAAWLGRTVSPLLALQTPPLIGEAAIQTASQVPGAAQLRAAFRAPLVFAQPWRAPAGWWSDQIEHGSRPSFLAATVAAHRATLDLSGQRYLLLDRLHEVEAPALVLWGTDDLVMPVAHGREAVRRLVNARLELLSGVGHLPQVEQPDWVTAAVLPFLAEAGA